MHAASVHPEPGSNSRMFVYYMPSGTLYRNPSFILASFTFVWVYITLLDENVFRTLLCFVLLFLLFNFQWPRRPLSRTAWILYLIFPKLSIYKIDKIYFLITPADVTIHNFSKEAFTGLPFLRLVGHQGLEPRTDRLWAGSSNQLS